MSQHDYDIANQTAPNFRSDLNDALGAIATNNSGASAPSTTYANQWWYDTTNDILKIRSEADDAWINVGYLDQSTNEFKPYVGADQIDSRGTSVWEAGTSTDESVVSPAKVKAAIEALASVDTTSVLSATAGASEGAVGTYVFAKASTSDISFGSTVAGSNLNPTSGAWFMADDVNFGNAFFDSGSALSGTWRCMGTYDYDDKGVIFGATLWLRIS